MTRKPRPPAARALALATMLVLGLALPACGGDDKPKGTTIPPQPSTTPAVPTTANPAPPSTLPNPTPSPQPGTQQDGGTGGTPAPGLPPGAPAQPGSDNRSPSERYQEYCAANPGTCAN